MKSTCIFYNIFSLQELVLKFNNLQTNNIITLEKSILFKPQPKDTENNLNEISNDLRYVFEFLTNTKITKFHNTKFICKRTVPYKQTIKNFLYLSYLIYSRCNIILENLKFDSSFPVIQRKKKSKIALFDNSKNYFDLKFNNGLDLAFLSDNEYISHLKVDFYMRLIFKQKKIKNIFIYYKQLVYFSLIGAKYCLLLKS